eukprot:gene4763-9474_t
MEVDPVLIGCGETEGLEKWRVENLKLVKLEEVTGKLYSGDSYIFLFTKKAKTISWNIHFWLGKDTSLDEAGIAAYKAVEMDEHLGGSPMQYREVEGNESSLFLSYFRHSGGLEYLPGGVSSGFHHVEKGVHRNRLLHLKGKRTVRVSEVPITSDSLNINDVFILDAGMLIFVYNGSRANLCEKAKGVDVACQIRVTNKSNLCDDGDGMDPEIIRINEERDQESSSTSASTASYYKQFWDMLGGEPQPKLFRLQVQTEGDGVDLLPVVSTAIGNDNGHSDNGDSNSNGDGDLLYRSMLSSDSVYLLDPGGNGNGTRTSGMGVAVAVAVSYPLYLWIGSTAPSHIKRQAFVTVNKYSVSISTGSGSSVSVSIQRELEGMESSGFRQLFTKWPYPVMTMTMTNTMTKTISADEEFSSEDLTAAAAAVMVASVRQPQSSEKEEGEGVVSGTVKVWVVDNFKMVEIPKDNLFSKLLVPGMCQNDMLLELVMLISTAATEPQICDVLASSTVIQQLYQLWKEKGEDVEILLQLMHCFYRFFLHPSSKEEAMYGTRAVVDMMDCLSHRNAAVRKMAETATDLVLELDRKEDGELGVLGQQIKRKRFESYNQVFLQATQLDIGSFDISGNNSDNGFSPNERGGGGDWGNGRHQLEDSYENKSN